MHANNSNATWFVQRQSTGIFEQSDGLGTNIADDSLRCFLAHITIQVRSIEIAVRVLDQIQSGQSTGPCVVSGYIQKRHPGEGVYLAPARNRA